MGIQKRLTMKPLTSIERKLINELFALPHDRLAELANRLDDETLNYYSSLIERAIAEEIAIAKKILEEKEITDVSQAASYLKKFTLKGVK